MDTASIASAVRTKEELFQIAGLCRITQDQFVTRIRQLGLNGSFDPDMWHQYMEILAKMAGGHLCGICGAPAIPRYGFRGFLGSASGAVCVVDKHHFYELATSKLREKLEKKNGSDNQ